MLILIYSFFSIQLWDILSFKNETKKKEIICHYIKSEIKSLFGHIFLSILLFTILFDSKQNIKTQIFLPIIIWNKKKRFEKLNFFNQSNCLLSIHLTLLFILKCIILFSFMSRDLNTSKISFVTYPLIIFPAHFSVLFCLFNWALINCLCLRKLII